MKAFPRITALALFGLLLLAIRPTAADEPVRVLFVGNSQIYTGNLPAVFAAVSQAGGRTVAVEMLVKGGAALSDRLADGSLADALKTGRYDWIVLQERGGDALCHGPAATRCDAFKSAVEAIAAAARQAGVTPILLGTYQPHPEVSRRLEVAEAAAASSMRYVAVSERIRSAVEAEPGLSWFAADGMHPGVDQALLVALLLHEALFGDTPIIGALEVAAPGYSPRARFFPPLLASEKSVAMDDAPEPRYSADTAARVAAIARRREK